MEAFTLNCAALLSALCGQREPLQQQAMTAITIAKAHGFSGMVEMAKIYRSWAQAQNGHREETLHEMQQNMSTYQIGGGDAFRAAHLALYGDACGTIGHAAKGLAAVDEALALAQRTGGRYYEAELYRIKGELTLQKGARDWGLEASSPSPQAPSSATSSTRVRPRRRLEASSPSPQAPSLKPLDPSGAEQEAEGYFLKAIEISRQQGAKSFELRATTSLVRLRQHQATSEASNNTQHVTRAKLDEAHSLLSNLYNWFTEGFETQDLQEAKALLEALPR